MTHPAPSGRWLLPLAIVLVLAVLYRVPPLLNAGDINSDAAVVGLQGQHMLRGEWQLHLWRADYQGVFDPLLAGIFCAVLGPKPSSVFMVPVVGLLAMVGLAFDLLRRRVGPWGAAALVMPLVFAPMASNSPMVYVMRQSLATALVLGVWLADRGRLRLAALVWAFAVYVDIFAVVALPALAVFAAAVKLGEERFEALVFGPRGRRVLLAVTALGVVALLSLIAVAAKPRSNFVLLVTTCLPFALGAKVFIHDAQISAPLWSPPLPVLLLQLAGAAVFVASVVSAVLLARAKAIPFALRRLGMMGVVVTAATLAAFCVSGKVADMWSCRYLAPIFWFCPFTFAPLAHRLGTRKLARLHAPYWATALLGGWLSYGVQVDGARPVVHPRANGEAEAALRAELLRAGVHEAESHYWLAYRLTFLFQEDPLVVPFERAAERHPPYRLRTDAAPFKTLIFNPLEPRADPDEWAAKLGARGIPFERKQVATYTVFYLRPSSPAP
ncbi:MAG: hypothetical protein KIT84_38510 [Labilithrix sp.]|nr:hypothetical protein [Labilithrix sp.]MCW5816954.1 hypothetical protein [Labilithrix sp.]